MNKILMTTAFALFIVLNVFSQDKAILFPLETNYDWGHVYMGEKVEHTFQFKNKGNIPLIIFEATSGCGCTVPEAPKKPILPGEIGSVKVIFDSTGKIDKQHKNVTLRANTNPEYTTVYISGMVYKKPTNVQLSVQEQIELKKKQKEDARIAKEKAELAKIEAERLENERLYQLQEAEKKRKRDAELDKSKASEIKKEVINTNTDLKNTTTGVIKPVVKIGEKEEIEKEVEQAVMVDSTSLKPTTVIVDKNDKNYTSKFKSFFNIGKSKDDK